MRSHASTDGAGAVPRVDMAPTSPSSSSSMGWLCLPLILTEGGADPWISTTCPPPTHNQRARSLPRRGQCGAFAGRSLTLRT